MNVYQNGCALVFSVVETVNAYGYAYFDDGQLLRAICGDIDRAITTDFGPLLPEEIGFGVVDRDGRKMIADLDEEPVTGADGCDITFALTAKFLGVPLNQFVEKIQVEIFEI